MLLPEESNAKQNLTLPADSVLTKIETSATESEVMEIVQTLSDVFGPRLMGTPNYFNSVQWSKGLLESWGIDNVTLHNFDKGHLGWSAESFSVRMIEPTTSQLSVQPQAYTKSIDGQLTGEVVFASDLNEVYEMKGQLTGKILLMDNNYRPVSSPDFPLSRRLTTEQLAFAEKNEDPNDLRIGYHSRRSINTAITNQENRRTRLQEFFQFCENEGIISIIEASDYPYGIIHADGNRNTPSYMREYQEPPIASFVMSNEHFGRLKRLYENGLIPELEVSLESTFYNNPDYNVNLIAEIEGSDPNLKNEFVIIGAHLDSWHSGTGAVDNASGSAVMLEAIRLIKESGLKPKRTIRLILWGGEEQIFAGSLGFTQDHVGNITTGKTKKEHSQISAYLNLDNGAGRIRGLYMMGNDSAKTFLKPLLSPFENDNTLTIQNANQTDHELFDRLNIPAFQFIQDPLDYISAVHHTNIDAFEYVPEKDSKFNSIYIAYLAYQLASSDEPLPRKPFNHPMPSLNGNTEFFLEGYEQAQSVTLVGNFNNWDMWGLPLKKVDGGWVNRIELEPGSYYYKFIVDDMWTSNPSTPVDQLQKDGKGHGGLSIKVVEE